MRRLACPLPPVPFVTATKLRDLEAGRTSWCGREVATDPAVNPSLLALHAAGAVQPRSRGKDVRAPRARSPLHRFLGLTVVALLFGNAVVVTTGTTAPHRVGWATFGDRFASANASNCSATALASLSTSPAKFTASPLATRMVTAIAVSPCGGRLTVGVTYAWWLSSVSLGTLNNTNGASTVYTACIAPMDGTLHVKATNSGITLYANSSIAVSAQASAGSGAPSSPVGQSGGTTLPWAGIGVASVLLGGAVVVLMVGLRKKE